MLDLNTRLPRRSNGGSATRVWSSAFLAPSTMRRCRQSSYGPLVSFVWSCATRRVEAAPWRRGPASPWSVLLMRVLPSARIVRSIRAGIRPGRGTARRRGPLVRRMERTHRAQLASRRTGSSAGRSPSGPLTSVGHHRCSEGGDGDGGGQVELRAVRGSARDGPVSLEGAGAVRRAETRRAVVTLPAGAEVGEAGGPPVRAATVAARRHVEERAGVDVGVGPVEHR